MKNEINISNLEFSCRQVGRSKAQHRRQGSMHPRVRSQG